MANNYSKEIRQKVPFATFTNCELLEEAKHILSKLPKSIKDAQYHQLMEPLTYLWDRLDSIERKKLNQLMTAHVSGLHAIRWLPKVKALIEKQKYERTKGGHGHVYFILLDEDRHKTVSSKCGIYIGQSKYNPQNRYEQHKAGIHSSGKVENYGKFLLESISFTFAPITRKEALRLEAHCYKIICEAKLSNLPTKNIHGGH